MIKPEDLAKTGTEHAHQCAVFAWAGLNQHLYPQLKWLHAIPNANSHRMVAEGVRAGIADIFLPWLKWNWSEERLKYLEYAGLYLEMKTEKRRNQKDGGCSQDQIDFIDYATKAGYKCHVCYSWTEARDRILEYISCQ
jgi:hypothetical protein